MYMIHITASGHMIVSIYDTELRSNIVYPSDMCANQTNYNLLAGMVSICGCHYDAIGMGHGESFSLLFQCRPDMM